MTFRSRCGLLVFAIAAATPGEAQLLPPTKDSLAAITARGRALAEYDRAAWHATDAVLALRPDQGEILTYIAQRQEGGWLVVFGRLSDGDRNLQVVYEARQGVTERDSFSVVRHSPARVDSGKLASAARALAVAKAVFGVPNRPYNAAVLPTSNGDWFVYLLPAQTHPRVFPLGADVRYHVSADGRDILRKRQMHNAVLEFAPPPDSVGVPQADFHAAVLDNIPEDTDVFHVLVRQPRIPHVIVTDAFVYRLDITGIITLMGRTEDVLPPESPP